jgi:hypothetical protein
MFGLDFAQLEQIGAIDPVTNIPFIVLICVKAIEEKGIDEVGLYRVSGGVTSINRIRDSFSSKIIYLI